ncbi:hypothetical protein AAF712_012427 [Marasmius tenuissimus]|uniref:Uncharacterized protein n=1 Tax=Marasmius tenuissimus TaxID=585030 RepID=A0ABR2ZHU4_9AGAR
MSNKIKITKADVEQENRLTKRDANAERSSSSFDDLSKVRPDLVPTALQLSRFAGHYLRLGNPNWFDWESFLQAVLRYNGNDLLLLRPNQARGMDIGQIVPFDEGEGELIKGDSREPNHGLPVYRNVVIPLTQIVDWIAQFITTVVGMPINRNEIFAKVEYGFTNLQWASQRGFASFRSTSTGTNSSWEYRITFEAPLSGDRFLSFVSTLELAADIRTESSW